MRFQFQSPALLLAAFIILAFCATGAVILAAAAQPSLDAPIMTRPGTLPILAAGKERLVVGMVSDGFEAGGSIADRAALSERLAATPGLGLVFEDGDFVEDPDMLPDYAASSRFFERQGLIRGMLDEGEVRLVTAAPGADTGPLELPRVAVIAFRGIAAMPASFWLQTGVGLFVILVAAVFLALRPRSFAVSAFAFAGLGITGSAYTAAIYSSRQFGMTPTLIESLSLFNHLFTASFGVGIIGLFSVYPVAIADPRKTALPAAIVSYGSILVSHLRLLPHDLVMLQNVVAALLAAILLAVFLQYRATRGRPADRAALMWLGLSVISGSAAFVALVILPVAVGSDGIITQAFGFVLLGMIYAGIAFAVSRYRLFDIGRWSYRILIYAGMIVSLLLLDLAFVLGLQMSEQASLAVASIIMLALYFPLRDLVHDRLFRKSDRNLPDLYRMAVATAYKFTPEARRDAWRRLMIEAFQPGHVEALAAAPTGVRICDEGLEIELPAYPWSEPVALGFAAQGRRLFDRDDVELVEELAEIAASAHADRLSYEKGAEEERHRIARDLHDDVGSTLLSGLHAVDEGRRQETLVEALSDIRRIAHDLAGRELSMERFVAQLRHDMRGRAQAQGRAFEWPLGGADDDHTVLPYRFHHNLSAIVREAVSNALKHGEGLIRITAEIEDDILTINISNPLPATPGDAEPGIGLRNIAARAAELGGGATGAPRDGRFALEVALPLPGAAT